GAIGEAVQERESLGFGRLHGESCKDDHRGNEDDWNTQSARRLKDTHGTLLRRTRTKLLRWRASRQWWECCLEHGFDTLSGTVVAPPEIEYANAAVQPPPHRSRLPDVDRLLVRDVAADGTTVSSHRLSAPVAVAVRPVRPGHYPRRRAGVVDAADLLSRRTLF